MTKNFKIAKLSYVADCCINALKASKLERFIINAIPRTSTNSILILESKPSNIKFSTDAMEISEIRLGCHILRLHKLLYLVLLCTIPNGSSTSTYELQAVKQNISLCKICVFKNSGTTQCDSFLVGPSFKILALESQVEEFQQRSISDP